MIQLNKMSAGEESKWNNFFPCCKTKKLKMSNEKYNASDALRIRKVKKSMRERKKEFFFPGVCCTFEFGHGLTTAMSFCFLCYVLRVLLLNVVESILPLCKVKLLFILKTIFCFCWNEKKTDRMTLAGVCFTLKRMVFSCVSKAK